jgi:hypothetical protein
MAGWVAATSFRRIVQRRATKHVDRFDNGSRFEEYASALLIACDGKQWG